MDGTGGERDVSLLPWPYSYTMTEQEIVKALYRSRMALDTLGLMAQIIVSRTESEEYRGRIRKALQDPNVALSEPRREPVSVGKWIDNQPVFISHKNTPNEAERFLEYLLEGKRPPPLSARVLDILSRISELEIPNYNFLNRELAHLKKVQILDYDGKGETKAIRVWRLTPGFIRVLDKSEGGSHDNKGR